MRQGANYPPFMIVLYWPFSLVSENLAYFIFSIMLQGFLFFSIHWLVNECQPVRDSPRSGALAASVIFWALFNHTYPVVFSLERGNSDLVSLGIACAFLAALQNGRFFLATVFLTLATQIKIYPGLLVFLLLNRAGWRFALLFGILNIGALFTFGLAGLIGFLENVKPLMAPLASWEGNHSFQGYFMFLFPAWSDSYRETITKCLKYGTLAAFAGAWLVDSFRRGNLWTFSKSPSAPRTEFTLAEIALIGMACQVMCLVPGTSHDYKLVIQILPTMLLLSRAVEAVSSPGISASWLLAVLGIVNALIFAPYKLKMPLLMIAFLVYLALWTVARRGEVEHERSLEPLGSDGETC